MKKDIDSIIENEWQLYEKIVCSRMTTQQKMEAKKHFFSGMMSMYSHYSNLVAHFGQEFEQHLADNLKEIMTRGDNN